MICDSCDANRGSWRDPSGQRVIDCRRYGVHVTTAMIKVYGSNDCPDFRDIDEVDP